MLGKFNNKTVAKVGGTLTVAFAIGGFAAPATAALLFDRGLPIENLNDISGADRSNIRWATDTNNQGFYGDDFTIGAAGETYVVNTIRTWMVPGLNIGELANLGEWFESVTLFTGGASGSDVSPVASAVLGADGSVSNPNVAIAPITYDNDTIYENFGDFVRIWQVDFNHLNWQISGGMEYRFGVRGVGREIPGFDFFYPWLNHAANAFLSGSPQDGADNLFLDFDATGSFLGSLDTNGNGWNKSSDVNVQVFGQVVTQTTPIPEPASTLGLLTFGVLGAIGQRVVGLLPISKRGTKFRKFSRRMDSKSK